MNRLRGLLIASILLLASPAIAQNLVTNGDFSTGTTFGWQVSTSDPDDMDFMFVGTGTAPQAHFFAAGPVEGTGRLLQDLSTVRGEDYTVSFDFRVRGVEGGRGADLNSFMRADFDGHGTFFLLRGAESMALDGTGWHTFSTVLHAFTNHSDLLFTFANEPGFYDVTNISVTLVPEPETYAMMVAGLGLLGFIARRRGKLLQATA